jgi:adenosyl cobinamide kinase/adenosyl cobinamide phosphate guanylyltransferase
MIFVIGGEYQGKLNYILNLTNLKKEDVADGLDGSEKELSEKPIIYNFHLLIKRLLMEEDNIDLVKKRINDIIWKNPNVIIISNEIGYGVVPIEKFDRTYRELTGRISCEIAKEAKEVHRVICGIGSMIKKKYD